VPHVLLDRSVVLGELVLLGSPHAVALVRVKQSAARCFRLPQPLLGLRPVPVPYLAARSTP
jgi:hypothetical protein